MLYYSLRWSRSDKFEHTLKPEQTTVGFGHKKKCPTHLTQTLSFPRVNFFQERQTPAEGHDCGTGKAYRCMAYDGLRQLNTGQSP